MDVNFYALNPKRMIKLEECVGANPQGRLWGGSESFRVLGETSEVALPSLNRTSCGFQRGLRGGRADLQGQGSTTSLWA